VQIASRFRTQGLQTLSYKVNGDLHPKPASQSMLDQ
jgi:hypothetical protein